MPRGPSVAGIPLDESNVRNLAGNGFHDLHKAACSDCTLVNAKTSHAKTDDEHNVETDAMCRFCYELTNVRENPLLSPCLCSGSQRWVHRECLKRWQVVSQGPLDKFSCDVCCGLYMCELLERRGQCWGWKASRLVGTFIGILGCIWIVLRTAVYMHTSTLPPAQQLRVGSLLVSTHDVRGVIFSKAVILVVEDSLWGTKGYFVNQPLPLPPSFNSVWSGVAGDIFPLEGIGGPQETSYHVGYLYRNRTRCGRSTKIVDGVWWKPSLKRRMLPGNLSLPTPSWCLPAPSARLHGYIRWWPSLLRLQILLGSWTYLDATPDLVFPTRPDELWDHLTIRVTLD